MNETTAGDRAAAMVTALQNRAQAHGLDVRCPACNAGIGKWCVREGVDYNKRTREDIVVHEARVAVASVA